MDLSGLSLDQAPPYNVVQRFFLTAPAFLFLAGIGLVVLPGYPFYNIISSNLIGIAHLVTLGFMTMTMFGAFFQMLPVVAGVKIRNPRAVSAIVYFFLTAGIFLLSGGYVFSSNFLLPIAAVFLALSVLTFVSMIIFNLLAVQNASDTITAMRLSLFSLLVLMALGVTMLLSKLDIIPYVDRNLLSVHIGWAVFGWVMLLIMGVSFQVIPMFYVAPVFPAFFRKVNIYLIYSLLIAYTSVVFIFNDKYDGLLAVIRAGVYILSAAFATATLRVIGKRRRKLPDPSLLFWKTSMIFLMLAMGFALFLEVYDGSYYSSLVVLTGFFLIVGFGCTLIIGMMYKIVPFLSWFHLASRGIFDAPTMKDMLPDNRIILHFYTYLLFLVSMISIVITPEHSGKITGAALIFTSLILWINLVTVVGKYREISKKH